MAKGKIAHILRNIVEYGKEMILKDKASEVRQMLAHDCKSARYFRDKAFLVVVEDRIIVTVHLAEHGKWIEKPKS
jgi:predicted ribosome-associated RNA-binding protein Tma20